MGRNRHWCVVSETEGPGSRPDPTFPGSKDGRGVPTSQDCMSSEMLGCPWGLEHTWLSVSRNHHLNGVALCLSDPAPPWCRWYHCKIITIIIIIIILILVGIVSSGAILSDCGPGTEIYVIPNSMFQCGNNFMKLYSFAEQKVINPGKFKIHWWGR